MKKKSINLKFLLNSTVLSVTMMMFLFVASCKKDENQGLAPTSSANGTEAQSQKMRASVSEAMTAFATRNSPNRTEDWGDPAYNYTSYSTPSANVYQWSNPTTGTSFTLSESTGGGGGGLGMLAYNNKSFDYNYVLTIKASSADPVWSGFLNGRDLIGVVAIDADGDISTNNFTMKNFAIFLVATAGGNGTYEFNDFSSTSITNTFAIGEIIDLSDVPGASLANFMNGGKVYFTSGGHIIVSSSDFTMDSDAEIMDVETGNEFGLSGTIMFE